MSGISYSTFERDFKLEKRLGKGNYATVTQVTHLLDQRSYAHKCIEMASADELAQAFNQIETNRCIDDDRTVRIRFYYTRENKKTGKFELGLIMDLCCSNLAESIKSRRRKSEYFGKKELKEFLATLLPFFAKMQRKGFLHRDIKPDNILLFKNSFNKIEYKVADFGFSIMLNAYSTLNIAGTMEYVSPKLMVKFKDNKLVVPGHNFKDDVYSFGKTLYEFMTLESSGPVDPRKLLQCSNRYGSEYCGLLSLMLREVEIERPDFIYLESYATHKELINENASEISKNNYLSISTVNGVNSDRRLSLSKAEKNRSKSKQKNHDLIKTRRKEFEIDSDLKLEYVPPSKINLKASMAEDDTRRKVVAYGQAIHSMAVNESCLFIGSAGKFGIMLLANQKIIKLRLQSANAVVSCIKVDPMKRFIYFGSVDSKLYTIEITQIKKLIIDNNESFRKKNEIQVSMAAIKCKQIDTGHSISTFDCYSLDDNKDPVFIVGHCTGEISYITANKKTTQLSSISRSPITQVTFHEGCVYSSSTDGVFRREMNLSMSQGKEMQAKNFRLVVHEKNSTYRHSSMLISFQIISNCKANEAILQENNKYLAIILSYDGLAHIISRAFQIRRMIDLNASYVPTAVFHSTASDLGVDCCAVDVEGAVFSLQGKGMQRSEDKQVSSIIYLQNSMYFGSFNKTLTILSKREKLSTSFD